MIGSLIRGDNSGLGTLGREFFEQGVISKALVVPNGVYQVFMDRFPGQRKTGANHVTDDDIEWLLKGIDCLLMFETPYRWDIIPMARKRGIKTILMVMHEGLPDPPPYQPDVWLCPSSLEMDLKIGGEKVFLPVPVNTKRLPWKKRERAKVFVHNAGHGGSQMRNGTPLLLEAMKHVKSNIELIIRSQMYDFKVTDSRIRFERANYLNYWDLWKEGDVFVFPEKFNGLSLPVQEAYASGMMIMSTDRKPLNEWLPKEPLIPIKKTHKERVFRYVDVAEIEPEDIASKIDEYAGEDISSFSLKGKKWAEENSWKKLKTKYINLCLK